MSDIQYLKKVATQVRRDIIRMVHAPQSGHPGGSLGCVEFFTALYFGGVMKHSTNFSMEGKNEDVFILSNGHISPVWYSVLARSGYFPVVELATFRRLNSRLQGHPTTHDNLPGVRIASGSLGQGLSVAIGIALTKKLEGDKQLLYVLTGDGELQEGQVWEAMMFAAHHKVDNVIVTVDWNGQQIDGPNEKVMSLGDLEGKWRSFGWEVLHNGHGNDMQSVLDAFAAAKTKTGQGKPVVVLMKTEMGFGVDYMQGTHEWHGKAPNDALTEKALAQLEETLGDY
jgi:transketolase